MSGFALTCQPKALWGWRCLTLALIIRSMRRIRARSHKRQVSYKKVALLVVPLLLVGSAAAWQLIRKPNTTPLSTPQPTAQKEKTAADTKEALGATTKPKPKPKPRPQPTAVAQPVAASPGSLLNLSSWKLTLPTNTARSGNPDEVFQPELAIFSNSYFRLTGDRRGVVFNAPVGGAHTSGSSYPRSELREMKNGGKEKAAWSNASGLHTLTLRQAITHLPVVKPDVVAGQIHDGSDDVIQVRLRSKRLEVWWNDGDNRALLDANYALGKVHDLKIEAANRRVGVWYNGVKKADIPLSGSGWYFKAGCYTQSNTSKGDAPSAYGEVVIYNLGLSHR
jgi:hypothetical protein